MHLPVPKTDLLEAAAAATGLPAGVGAPVVRRALWRSGYMGEAPGPEDLWQALPVLEELLREHLPEDAVARVLDRLSVLACKAPSLRAGAPRAEPPTLAELTAQLRENNLRMSLRAPANDDQAVSVLEGTWFPPEIKPRD